jgi:hypothetical protein
VKVIVERNHSGLEFIWKKQVTGRKHKGTASDVCRSEKCIQFTLVIEQVQGKYRYREITVKCSTHTHSVQQEVSTGSSSTCAWGQSQNGTKL